MDIEVFKEECQRLMDRFPELDKSLLNVVWHDLKKEDDGYIRKVVSQIFSSKIPGTSSVTRNDFILRPKTEVKTIKSKEAVSTLPRKETPWAKDGLNRVLKKHGVESLWEAVVKQQRS